MRQAGVAGVTAPTAGPGNWNLPNAITIVRILFAPAFLWLLLADQHADGTLRWVATALFVIGIATDGVDGHIARSRGLVTDLGKLLDPIADKILTGAALVGLGLLAELPWWVVAVILVREWGITVWRFAVIKHGVVAASRGGKLKTVFQSVAIGCALAPLWTLTGGWVFWLDGILMTIAVLLTVVTGIDYLVSYARARRAGGAGRRS
ncbi:MAG TPA: CDP-diacylglycerol--glycerol-3-phosphate 3-phosphatidyltransferase [Microbacteriaceae bacterium]|nr:CDP-diacylglycerol--glycerol-3-phosphate 3-phosphatidyltransferase [Microbacteriaceae bacterium]